MASLALDLTTIGHALNALLDEGLGQAGWNAANGEQKEFLDWYAAHRDEITQLSDLTAKASTDLNVLNAFLVEHGFEPKFKRLDGIGVVSILDMLVEWLDHCRVGAFDRYDEAKGYVLTEAFVVPPKSSMVYEPADDDPNDHPLIELRTKSGHSLWLRETTAPTSGLDLAMQAHDLLTVRRHFHPWWTDGVMVPMLNLNLDTDLTWLLGLSTTPDWFIDQANQQFKLRVNHEGARVQVATSLGLSRGAAPQAHPYTIRRPFIGCFTQKGHPSLPLAAFWADYDCWKQPEGLQ